MHVAPNPEVQQDKLYVRYWRRSCGGNGWQHVYCEHSGESSTLCLYAVWRETYRLTPPAGTIAIKTASQSSIEIHGESLAESYLVVLKNKYNCEVISWPLVTTSCHSHQNVRLPRQLGHVLTQPLKPWTMPCFEITVVKVPDDVQEAAHPTMKCYSFWHKWCWIIKSAPTFCQILGCCQVFHDCIVESHDSAT
jgi:hypothetical protein